MFYAKKLNVLYKETEYSVRRDLIRHFLIIFKKKCDVHIKKMIDF